MHFTLITFDQVESTQDWVRAWAELGAAEGLVVQAGEQIAGRGRLQRSWWSPPRAGLYLSLLLRPDIPLAQSHYLTMLVSLAAIDACRAVAAVAPRPKWPNDLLLRGRKLAGVLAELAHEQARLRYAVIGLGLNINHRFAGTELAEIAISLSEATGREFAIDAVRDAFLQALSQRYRALCMGWSPLHEWRERLEPLGRRVSVAQTEGKIWVGVAEDVSEAGALLVRDEQGVLHTVWAGDVRVFEQVEAGYAAH
ncbi:MAG: biotin--[acetyl-CoA-carboxylase] ligase [Chloroflexi bacterium]|nr:biotin--[acetyl-CoA-carboxylase] ligase [Chloroflexota bacterium]